MIMAFLVFLPFTMAFFLTSFDLVYFRFDLTLFTFRLLIDKPSYFPNYLKACYRLTKSFIYKFLWYIPYLFD